MNDENELKILFVLAENGFKETKKSIFVITHL